MSFKKLKNAGIVHLVIGIVLILLVGYFAHMWLADYFFYNEPSLVDILSDENAAAISGMCRWTFVLPLLAFFFMYMSYAGAVKPNGYAGVGLEVSHAVIPGVIFVLVSLAVGMGLLPLLAKGMLNNVELENSKAILYQLRYTNLLILAADSVLYILCCLFLRPDRVMRNC